MISKQIDNFFELPNLIYKEVKKIKLFKVEDHPEHKNKINKNTWPGFRSDELNNSNVLLKYFITKYLSLSNLEIENKKIDLYIHARLAEDKTEDFIHTDGCKHSLLIYLSDTNLNSGTKLFNSKNEEINDFKFVQNRLVFFDAKYRHTAYGHYGDNFDNCRLTINGFIR